MKFDVLKMNGNPVKEQVYIEIWLEENGELENWTDKKLPPTMASSHRVLSQISILILFYCYVGLKRMPIH